ncbi:diguanylate cyclase/phosphodiesterase [Enhygromyxa salina]|uniref:Diguanylate cyclase/phosphodiesterase n=1 Tax=Enhygromyxa salina TaxID=215803 RepID=A0A0C2A6G2_9BACT|nr:GGDEF domain-containing phosphodiesterase [Enhygromyxa salina]KIG18973.1 diguanylate cyclase/phosphodiesterase [Enhygromyxa salina]
MVGDDEICAEVAGLLAALRPPVQVHVAARAETLEQLTAELANTTENPVAILVAIDQLDTTNLAWMRRIVANTKLPMLVVVPAHSAQRSALRESAREVGALDCLLRSELSSPLLEAALTHARDHNLQNGRYTELRERFSLAIRGSRDGMWEWDLLRGRVYYSHRWRELLGLRNTDLPPTLEAWLSRVHPQDVERLRADLEANVSGESLIHENEHRVRDGANEWRWVMSRAVVHRNAEGRARRMAGSMTDVSAYRQRERAIRERSRKDTVTKLPDRRVFLERGARAVELSRAHDDYMFVVLMVAVDRITQIRDSYGIEAADQVVAVMAQRLYGCLRPEDHLFRYSTSKFAILIEDVEDPGFGTSLANRIHDVVGEPFEVDGAVNFTTVSIGMTSSAHGYKRVEDVVTDVSAATDSARDHGKGRHEIYDTSMRIESRTLLALEMAMRRALDADQFQLHYQPLVRMVAADQQSELLGFEALLRWEHPERGRISPVDFIPIAEDTGLIIPLGRWVMREAIRALQSWRAEFGLLDLCVSVNLSAKQIGDPLLLETIDAALAETGLPARCLKLELTESVMMDGADKVAALLQDIRSRGVQLWIDDFGTGYSSLGYLHRFPVDGLKIDRSFVSELDGTPASTTLVRTILNLASNLGLDVIAEGIETDVQAAQLLALECQHCQGWLFGKPMAPEGVRALLAGP